MLALTAVVLLSGRLAIASGPGRAGLLILAALSWGWLATLLSTFGRIRAMAHQPWPKPVGRILPLTAATVIGLALLGVMLVYLRW